VEVDFHGSTGYGQGVSPTPSPAHWGDWPLEDLQKGLAAALPPTLMDGDRVGALGASYGGFS